MGRKKGATRPSPAGFRARADPSVVDRLDGQVSLTPDWQPTPMPWQDTAAIVGLRAEAKRSQCPAAQARSGPVATLAATASSASVPIDRSGEVARKLGVQRVQVDGGAEGSGRGTTRALSTFAVRIRLTVPAEAREGKMTNNETTMSAEEAVDKIWDLVASIDICMFVTWDGEHQRARPMSARPDRDEGCICFLADVAGAKDEQIERFPQVTLAFCDNRAHDYVVITGTARVSNDREKIKELWSAVDRAWWDSADDPAIRVIIVAPDGAEIWKGPNRLVAGAKMLTAAVTGAKADFGESSKVDHL